MAKTNAERQRAYRERHLLDVDGAGHRLNMVIDVSAGAQLRRLAQHYGVTQRDMLEDLLQRAESDLLDGMKPKAEREYFG
jgi:hypothetical protein